MILVDTDHVSVLIDRRHALRPNLVHRLEATGDTVALSIVTVEEQMRGWLAQIHRVRDVHKQIAPYVRLSKLVDFLRDWDIIDWNEAAADEFVRLRSQRVRVSSQDLKIAAIAVANNATLLSANLQDFQRVPGLRVEDWLYG